MDTLLKAGAFAKLCRTTKETLRHYDRIGLLHPAARADNGYKLYALPQVVDFALVSALRSTGLALSEVRAFLEDPGSDRLQQTIGERVAEIERQQRDLEAKRQVLVETMEQARRLAEWLDGESSEGGVLRTTEGYRWRILFCEEERFIEGAIPYKEGCEDDFLAVAVEHLDYCERQGVGVTFQEAYRVDAAHVAEGDYAAGLCADARAGRGASVRSPSRQAGGNLPAAAQPNRSVADHAGGRRWSGSRAIFGAEPVVCGVRRAAGACARERLAAFRRFVRCRSFDVCGTRDRRDLHRGVHDGRG